MVDLRKKFKDLVLRLVRKTTFCAEGRIARTFWQTVGKFDLEVRQKLFVCGSDQMRL